MVALVATKTIDGIDVDLGAPWGHWPEPDMVPTKTKNLSVTTDRLGRLLMMDGESEVGYASVGGLREMSTRVGFDVNFVVNKLSPEVQAMVISDRLKQCDELDLTMALEPFTVIDADGRASQSETKLISNVVPSWRSIVSHAAVAQRSFDMLSEIWPSEVQIDKASKHESEMLLRFLTPEHKEVSPQLNDILRMGVEIRHRYGMALEASLFSVRLACLNGMTSNDVVFRWQAGKLGNTMQQLEWLTVAIGNAIESFDPLVEHAKKMAAAQFNGDPFRVLMERAKAMKIPTRFHGKLVEAFRTEPVMNEWGLLNAFTRLASHGDVTPAVSRAIQSAAGDWVHGFDIITARLPRPIASAVGAYIVDDEVREDA